MSNQSNTLSTFDQSKFTNFLRQKSSETLEKSKPIIKKLVEDDKLETAGSAIGGAVGAGKCFFEINEFYD